MSDHVDIRYSVVRYVPDPVRQEVLNVGVVVADGESLSAKLIPRGQAARLRALGYQRDLSFLKDLERELNRGRVSEQTRLPEGQSPWTVADLEKAAGEWGGTIQFSPMRPGRVSTSRDPLDYLFAKIVPTRSSIQRGPTRSAVKKKVRTGLLRVLSTKYKVGDARALVRTEPAVKGQYEEHVFDYGVANGRPLHLVQTVSFDVDNRDLLAAELDATKWAIADLHNAKRSVPISIVAAGTRQGDLREQTVTVLKKLHAPLFGENEYDKWLAYVDGSLPASSRSLPAAAKRNPARTRPRRS